MNNSKERIAITTSKKETDQEFDLTGPDAYLLWIISMVLNYDLSENYEFWMGESK